MRVLKLTGNIKSPAIAAATKFKNSDKMYYTLHIGSIGKDLWCYKIGLDFRHFKPQNSTDILTLSDDNYFIKPIFKNNTIVKDALGNDMYVITIDHMDNHKNDILLLWEIPNKYNYNNIEYKLDGLITELAIGYTGKIRSSLISKTPAPVLEITGDCEFSWTAEDDKSYYEQHIKYSYAEKEWEINPIKIKDK